MGEEKVIVNKKAKFEYEILDTVEAGMVLSGAEVKSLRLGHASLSQAFVKIINGQVFLINANITGYKYADLTDYEPTKTRKLLMSRSQIEAFESKLKSGNFALVPLKIYSKHRMLKLLVGIGRGRKNYEKRDVIKKRDLEREEKRERKNSR